MAGEDHAIGPEAVEAFGAALTAAGAEHEIVTYPGAPHSFFDRKQEQFAAESAGRVGAHAGLRRGSRLIHEPAAARR